MRTNVYIYIYIYTYTYLAAEDELGTSMVRFEIAELRAAVDAVAGERAQEYRQI